VSEHDGTWLGIRERSKPFVKSNVVLGVGLGGFIDGIVIHQVLQWHHMLSAYPDPSVANDIRLNVTADGLFHVGTSLFTISGVVMLWRERRDAPVAPSGQTIFGSVIPGWGLFNLVEGLVDHQLLVLNPHVGDHRARWWTSTRSAASLNPHVGDHRVPRRNDAVEFHRRLREGLEESAERKRVRRNGELRDGRHPTSIVPEAPNKGTYQ